MSNAVVTDWPSGSGNAGWPQEPTGMLMPGRVQGWPAGTQRAANAAERLLSQAVAWWDVEQYRDGDRFLRNRGTGGELLDLRLGSSLTPNTNDPLWLGPEPQSGYCYTPNVAGNRLTIPHVAGSHVGDTLDIRIDVAMDDWQGTSGFMAKATAATYAGASWMLARDNADRAYVIISNGTSGVFWRPTVFGTFVDGQRYRLRLTYTRNTGAGQYLVELFSSTSFNDPLASQSSGWTSLGSTTGADIGAMNDVNTPIAFGGLTSGGGCDGKVYGASVSVGGTVVMDANCDAITSGAATSFTEQSANAATVTINRSTSGRKSVAVPSRFKGGRPVMLLGNDDFLEVQDNWQHQLLNFDQGQSFTVLAVFRAWTTFTGVAIGKKTSTTGTAIGWYAGIGSLQSRISDGTTQPAINGTAPASGASVPYVLRVDRAPQIITVATRVEPSVTATSLGVGTLGNTEGLRVGRFSGTGTSYADMEFYGAAIFRRALSDREITLLSNYFTGRIA